MAEITIGDLLTWEPRLSLYHDAFFDGSELAAADEDREVTWVVTVRASLPVLPPLRGGELVIVPQRTVTDTGISLQELLREIASRGATGIIFDTPFEVPERASRMARALFCASCLADFAARFSLSERPGFFASDETFDFSAIRHRSRVRARAPTGGRARGQLTRQSTRPGWMT